MSPRNKQASDLIEHLSLNSHPEGGWFREIYRSAETIESDALPSRFQQPHSISTSIYYLLQDYDYSAFHRIKSDEIWHFYLGSPVKLYILKDGLLELILLGDNPAAGHVFQAVVPYGCWFAAEVSIPESFALMGCTVSPGFEFSDFEMASFQDLEPTYGKYATLIRRMTKGIDISGTSV
ncbi:MAG: cupin domain-containing protein [Bacteroidales bacterium]|nr:cupin domain-containing protein [Bacteroidales bacterium]